MKQKKQIDKIQKHLEKQVKNFFEQNPTTGALFDSNILFDRITIVLATSINSYDNATEVLKQNK